MSEITRICVQIKKEESREELKRNLEEWKRNPVALLFLTSIEELTIDDVTLRRQRMGPGPIPGSQRVKLTGYEEHELLVFTSREEPFPEDAVAEIRQERNVGDLHLPPSTVEVVLGLPDPQRLYVVLPTGVTLETPFSCNAPFIQDPARSRIKAPSLSPTNRWLLRRLGQLAATAMMEWLHNRSLELDVRAGAYRLLPKKPEDADSLEADVVRMICQSFADAIDDRPVLLAATGEVVSPSDCIAPPKRAYRVWPTPHLLQALGEQEGYVLNGSVPTSERRRLASWNWLRELTDEELVRRLDSREDVPRPVEERGLVELWSLVKHVVGFDYNGRKTSTLSIVPIDQLEVLLPPSSVVRLPHKGEAMAEQGWQYLVSLVHVVDPQWLRLLEGGDEQPDKQLQDARALLRDVQLDRATRADFIAERACAALTSRAQISNQDWVTIAHILAALDANTPEAFCYVCRDGKPRPPSAGVIGTLDPHCEALLPEDWLNAHVLHEAYFREDGTCTREAWRKWASSKKSRLLPTVPLLPKSGSFWVRGRDYGGFQKEVKEFLKTRGYDHSPWFYARVQSVRVEDWGFPDELLQHWNEKEGEDPAVWAKVAACILLAPSWYWEERKHASLTEHNATHGRRLCSEVLAEWVAILKDRPCLFDTHHQHRWPSELYVRSPETEPFLGIEPFVLSELDTDSTKPLLEILGARKHPAGLSSLLDRLRALTKAPNATQVLGEILKWCEALDRALRRCDSSEVGRVKQIFTAEALILSSENQWLKANEIYIEGSEEYPDPPLVHPAMKELPLWQRLGVQTRPSVQQVLDWLRNLSLDTPLAPGTLKRVRAALQRYPDQVWRACNCWLALDGRWLPSTSFRYRLTHNGQVEHAYLFPSVRAATADFTMLSAEVHTQSPFADLPDLSHAIEYRLTRAPRTQPPVEVSWLAAFSSALARVRLPDDNETQRVRSTAVRLAHSVWRQFDSSESVEVTPYIWGTPAGPSQPRDVFWDAHTIYVRRVSIARLVKQLACELGDPFGNKNVREAIKDCIDRSPEFVREYMEENFDLDPENESTCLTLANSQTVSETQQNTGSTERAIGPGSPDEVEWAVDKAGEEDTPATARWVQIRLRKQARFFERFASSRGYVWHPDARRFVHGDGSFITRTEPPFHWQKFTADGQSSTRYWVSERKFRKNAVEIGADVWNYFTKWPDRHALVIPDEYGRPQELAASRLLEMLEQKKIFVYPVKYLLVQGSLDVNE